MFWGLGGSYYPRLSHLLSVKSVLHIRFHLSDQLHSRSDIQRSDFNRRCYACYAAFIAKDSV